MNPPIDRIGILGGSGLYDFAGLADVTEHALDTPYGKPSDVIVTGRLGPAEVAFLARHGRGHRLIPSEVPYRANVYALKSLGVRTLLAISAVGSLREHLAPLDLVLPDQFLDLTRRRESTFFGDGIVAHVSMAEPTCAALRERVAHAFEAAALSGVRLHRSATYACIEGPAFSTRAESAMLRTLGADIVGMTNMPEARLAREAQIAYATLALVTDYDCWDAAREPVSADLAIANLMRNAAAAQQVAAALIADLHARPLHSPAHQALRSALVTPLDKLAAAQRARVDMLLR
ncbi:MAG: S-methyl-5'-thioadenosine phosphorylase [Betaproteobacteria bacterium]|nr:S-methyl-5'-thioadenosine phosphorylase [Betaproteobacteria bacterium]MBU6514213.1 S-methyl-5'-thioadenosine phosphorylase [Betaproteobacteria bacterium]MDE1957354.1 S-methyl-5'-thioadenosine phosphorylase [Betaproteobacteria bacterium]MDE2154193.1 S-methyl-5'-thioadenosine phosphorylase [Betaproteobacteria bacterium]MDE2478600.1 S-methyl-5'-thioadenosine phosphorylase [Betaproteobacteria bacterium]